MKAPDVFSEENRKTIYDFINMPVYLFNESEVICVNNSAEKLYLKEEFLQNLSIADGSGKISLKARVEDTNNQSLTLYLSVKPVLYRGTAYYLGEVTSVERYEESSEEKRFSYAYRLMLEMTQKIQHLETEKELYDYILEYSQKAVKNSALCSIMILENGYTKIVAKAGYDDSVYDIRFRLEDTFLYRATQGKCDDIINIGDLSHYYDTYYPAEISDTEETKLQSTISAPFYLNAKLSGMINFDSLERYSFDQADIELLTLVRNNVEIAVANQILYNRIRSAATCDALTGIANRRLFKESFEEMDKQKRWLVMFDIDNLKPTNDAFGHKWGDKIICDFADRLSEICCKSEMVARIGGDEFIGVFHTESQEAIMTRMEQLENTVSNRVFIVKDGRELRYSFSFGVASCEKCDDLQELIEAADKQMYQNKRIRHSLSDKDKSEK